MVIITPVIPVLFGWGQNGQKFRVILGYILSLKAVWAAGNLVSNCINKQAQSRNANR